MDPRNLTPNFRELIPFVKWIKKLSVWQVTWVRRGGEDGTDGDRGESGRGEGWRQPTAARHGRREANLRSNFFFSSPRKKKSFKFSHGAGRQNAFYQTDPSYTIQQTGQWNQTNKIIRNYRCKIKQTLVSWSNRQSNEIKQRTELEITGVKS